jgi:hypothetical protein
VVLGNIFLNTALAIVDIAGIVGGTIGAGSWSGIAIHLLLLAGFLYYAGSKAPHSKRERVPILPNA